MKTVSIEKVNSWSGDHRYIIVTDHGSLWLSYTEMLDLAELIWRYSDPEEVAQILRNPDFGSPES